MKQNKPMVGHELIKSKIYKSYVAKHLQRLKQLHREINGEHLDSPPDLFDSQDEDEDEDEDDEDDDE